jgi:outer membrane scaffolding protein for murein synthesis (MipA/OmpV family)
MRCADLVILVAVLSFARSACVLAAEPPLAASAFSLSVGGGGIVVPDYPGSNSYRARPLPGFDARYGDLVFFSVQDGLGVNLIRHDGFTAGPLAVYQPGRHQSDNSSALRGLSQVGDGIGVGGFASYVLGDWSAKITAVQDVTNGNRGFVLNPTLTYGTFVPPAVLAVTTGLTFADNRYNRSFFGISGAESRRSGLAAYDADGGLNSADIALTGVYSLTERISLVALAGYSRLLDEAADSPLVKDEGSPNQFAAGLFLSYKLF